MRVMILSAALIASPALATHNPNHVAVTPKKVDTFKGWKPPLEIQNKVGTAVVPAPINGSKTKPFSGHPGCDAPHPAGRAPRHLFALPAHSSAHRRGDAGGAHGSRCRGGHDRPAGRARRAGRAPGALDPARERLSGRCVVALCPECRPRASGRGHPSRRQVRAPCLCGHLMSDG